MREEHRPYFIKKIQNRFNHFYVEHFFRPHFDRLGVQPQIMNPKHIEVFGHHISVGNYAHMIGAPDNKIKLTTWQTKQMQARLVIGDYCLISPGTHITAGASIVIGNNCMFAANCYISDSDWHGLYNRTRPFRCTAPITLGDNVWVGHGAKIGKGVTVGENSVIGAGSVVTRDIPPNCVAAGNPARVVKQINPDRRMLKREVLFTDSEHYFDNMDQLDRLMLADNTFLGWLRTIFFPRRTD